MDQLYLQSFLDGRSMWDIWVGVLVLAAAAITLVLLRHTKAHRTLSSKKSGVPSTTFAPKEIENYSPHFPATQRGCPDCHEYLTIVDGKERCTNPQCRFGLKKK